MCKEILLIIATILFNIFPALGQELKLTNAYYLKSFSEMCDILVLESYNETRNKYNTKAVADDVFMFEPSMSGLIEKELKDLEGVAQVSSLISLTVAQNYKIEIKDIKVRVKQFSQQQLCDDLEVVIQNKIEEVLMSCKITQLVARSGKENFVFGMNFAKKTGNVSESVIEE